MKSKIYHQNLIKTYNKHPEIFNPSHVLKMSEEELLVIIKSNIKHRYPNVALKKWINLSEKLENYKKLKEIILNMNSSEQLYDFINSIDGYGQKTGGLLLRTIVELNITPFKEINIIPIDRHDIEICYLIGIINKKKLNSKEIKQLNNCLIKHSKNNNINPSDLDKYLWTIGNDFCNKKKCNSCPLSENCMRNDENE